MNVAIDISPLSSGHSVRGVGFYLEHLKTSLLQTFPEETFEFITKETVFSASADVVHYPYFDPYFLSLPLVKTKPTVVTVHDLTTVKFAKHFPPGLKGSLKWQIQKKSLRRSEAIIADSHASKNDIVALTGIAEEKIHVVYLAAAEIFKSVTNSAGKKKLRDKYRLPEKFVLYVGDATWNKNLPNLVLALQQLDIPIVMAGKALTQKDIDQANPWNDDLIAFQKAVEGDKRFIRLGFVSNDDLMMLYNSATLLLMPSRYEGFGLPVVEAMQSGCPVVTAQSGSLPEVGGEAVLYADPENPEDIAKKVMDVFTHKQLQETLRAKGIRQAKNFSWKKTAEQTMRVYEKIGRKQSLSGSSAL